MTQATNDLPTMPAWGAGAVLVGCAVASVALLASHPDGGGSRVLAEVLRREAAQAGSDAVVHGGFVLVLAIELVCFAALAVKTGVRRTSVLAAMIFALVGAGLLSASMILDGLITPAVATRYAAAPAERQEAARSLLVLIGAAINALMPLGLAFQGAAALAWGAALAPLPGRARIGGGVAAVLGLTVLAAAAMAPGASSPLALMIALVAVAAWTLAAGVLLATWRAPKGEHAMT